MMFTQWTCLIGKLAPSFTQSLQSVWSIFADRKGSRSEAERNTTTTVPAAAAFGTHSKRKTNAVSHKSPHQLNGWQIMYGERV